MQTCFAIGNVQQLQQMTDFNSSYVRSPRRLEDTSDWTSEAGLRVTGVTTWPKYILKAKLFPVNYLDSIVSLGVYDILIKLFLIEKRLHTKKSGTLATDTSDYEHTTS